MPTLEERRRLASAYTDIFNERVLWLDARNDVGAISGMPAVDVSRYPDLGPECVALLEGFNTGNRAWGDGYVRQASLQRQSHAALELLLLEQGFCIWLFGWHAFSIDELRNNVPELIAAVLAAVADDAREAAVELGE